MNTPLPFKIYNTLSRQVEDFKPVHPGKVGMYVCGVTPYGLSHVGNARTFIVFDTFVRFLRAAGWQVKYVRNFTDIDDKIIKRANDENRSAESVAAEFIQAFRDDMAGLNVLPADEEPLVSQTLPEITTHIQRLIERKHAYINPNNGDVLYEVGSFKDYGKLANRKLDEQQAGARVEVEPGKKHPFDFVLWKQAKPGEPSWPSPWGAGRPGWHIECSAMSCKHLQGDKETFDIHGGGMDLQFPHHECEIAQSEGAYDHRYVNHWMHVAFVNMAGEKMSKSLGNIMTVREALQKFDGRAIRLNMLMTHYRSPVDFSEESIRQAEAALKGLDEPLEKIRNSFIKGSPSQRAQVESPDSLLTYMERSGFYKSEDNEYSTVLNMLSHDLNTSQVIAKLFENKKEINKFLDVPSNHQYWFLKVLDVLGLLPIQWPDGSLPEELIKQLARIDTVRTLKDYTSADALRLEIESKFGGKVNITPQGAKWSKN